MHNYTLITLEINGRQVFASLRRDGRDDRAMREIVDAIESGSVPEQGTWAAPGPLFGGPLLTTADDMIETQSTYEAVEHDGQGGVWYGLPEPSRFPVGEELATILLAAGWSRADPATNCST